MTSVEPFVRWVQEKPGYWRLWARDVGRQMWYETIHVLISATQPTEVPFNMRTPTPRGASYEPEDA